MSSQNLDKTDGVVVQKPRSNIYTMMLILSLFAIVAACVILYMELGSYGEWPQWDVKGVGWILWEQRPHSWSRA